jgi:hypothetical protein
MTGPLYRTIPCVEDPAIRLPFRSDRLSMNYFPLRADQDCLQRFLDTELNFAHGETPLPPEVGMFRAAAPMVFFVASRHENLHSLDSDYGSITQNEFSFGFFAEWHRCSHGRSVFKDWVFINAYVFLDSELSTVTGRSHWGWPKLQLRVEGGECLAPGRLRGDVKAYFLDTESEAQPAAPLFALKRLRERSFSELWGSMPAWLDAPRLVSDYYRDAASTYAGFTRLALGAARFTQPGPWSRLLERGADVFLRGKLLSALDSRVVTVQQFADAEQPAQACFRAVIDSTIVAKNFRRGGLLGEDALLRGDTSGGYRLRISESKLAPIVERLGLLTERDRRDDEGRAVSTLRPWSPFWTELDVEYGPGKVLAWQAKDEPWQQRSGGQASRPSVTVQTAAKRDVKAATISSAVGFGITPPCALPTSARGVLLSFAVQDQAALARTLQAFALPPASVEAVHVLIASTLARAPGSKPVWQVAMCVPIAGSGEPRYVVPFEYLNHAREALSAREVQGRAARFAEFESAPMSWLDAANSALCSILSLRVEMVSKVGVGAFAKRQRLLELWADGPLPRASGVAAGKLSFDIVALKQFRHAESPLLASYQAQVVSRLDVAASTYGAASGALELRCVRHPNHDLVSALGLAVAETRQHEGLPEARLRPIRSLAFEGSFSWGRSENGPASFAADED